MVNEAIVQYGRDFEFDYQQWSAAERTSLVPQQHSAAPPVPRLAITSRSGFYAGANPDLPRFADPDERRLQLLDGFTWIHGKHVPKFGLEYNKVSDYDNNLYNGNGSYSYDWSYNFIADYLNLTTGSAALSIPAPLPVARAAASATTRPGTRIRRPWAARSARSRPGNTQATPPTIGESRRI